MKPTVAARPSESARAVMAAGLALVALAAAAAFGAGVVEAPEARFGALGAAAILGLAGAGVVGAWTARWWGGRSAEAAFDALLASADDVALLTDGDGVVLRAARRSADAVTASDALAGMVDDAAAAAYRLLRRLDAAAEAEALEPGATGPVAIRASQVGPNRILWRAAQVESRGAEGVDGDELIETLPVAVARLDVQGVIVFVNAAARAMLGPAAAPGARLADVIEGLGRSMASRIAEAARGDGTGRPEIARGEPDGREVFMQVSLTRAEIGGSVGLIAVLADATELKTLEAQFVQSQKMQAVGQLAGGVAHDFNNLLTAITGHTDLLLQRRDRTDLDYADLTQVRQNANRAAGLVRQLLAFSRKQTLRPKVVNLVDTLGETSHLLNRLLGERHALRMEHGEDLWLVKVDERQFEQVVMNLVVNARDAMPEGGAVLLRTANLVLAQEERRGRAVMPKGDYVRIDVIDEGVGIPEDKIDQIFEPFFTTKRAGEGTGLGLSTVYGIVKQTGGFVFADSGPGGATFTIYLPRHAPETVDAPAPRVIEGPADLTGAGAVMLIEDETSVRAFAARALKLRGYEVTEAASGEEAIDILADPDLRVDIIVSDVVMPGVDGPSCVIEARRQRPDVKVIFVSGYAEDALRRTMDGVGDCSFLPKPFSLNELTAKVKEVLEG